MRSLFRKELRSVRPFLVLMLFFTVLGWIFVLAAEFPDQYPLSKLMSAEMRTATQIFSFILAYALAAGTLVRERDEGTLAFLDALPTSRAQVFFCKAVVALGVLWLSPLSDLTINATLHALSRTSLDMRFHWSILLTSLVLDSVSCVVYLSLGLALSFLRGFSLLVMGLLGLVYAFLKESGLPFVTLLNIFTLGDPVFHGQQWIFPWRKLAVQLTMAAIWAGIAFIAFHLMGDRTQRLAGRVQRTRGRKLLKGLIVVLILGVWLGLVAYWSPKGDVAEGPQVTYASWANARTSTARYQFLYPENKGASVQPFIDGADAVEARVRSFLDAAPLDLIVVDLTSGLPRHAGLAYWKKVRMSLPFDASADSSVALLPVLAHETAHVHIEHLSGSRLHELFDSTRFFNEGLASYIEYHLFSPVSKLDGLRRVAAVMRARDEVKLEELFDGAQLRLKRDPDLVYSLGEVFVTALIQRYGDGAPGVVLKAFARENAPDGLTGFALWQDTFQSCGLNLSDVTDGFFVELDRVVTEHRAFVDLLPRLRGAVDQGADEITVHASHTGSARGEIVCRFRARADEADRFFESAFSLDGETFIASTAPFTDGSFWYQLGWRVNEAHQVLYEPWVEVRRQP